MGSQASQCGPESVPIRYLLDAEFTIFLLDLVHGGMYKIILREGHFDGLNSRPRRRFVVDYVVCAAIY